MEKSIGVVYGPGPGQPPLPTRLVASDLEIAAAVYVEMVQHLALPDGGELSTRGEPKASLTGCCSESEIQTSCVALARFRLTDSANG